MKSAQLPNTRLSRATYLAIAVASPLLLLLIWFGVSATGWVNPMLLPSPQAVVVSFWDMMVHGYSGVAMSVHITTSLWRIGVAFVCGSLLGVALGLWRARSAVVDAFWLVPSEILRPIPPLGLVPVFILWFGIGELSKILLIFVSVLLITMVSAREGAAGVKQDLLRAAQMMGASRMQMFLRVILPAALPQIMTGLRVAMGMALSILVAAELLGGDKGLGFVVLDAANFFRTSYVFAGVLVIGLIGLLIDRLFAALIKKYIHWQSR
jgi:taurine transport system permease protein